MELDVRWIQCLVGRDYGEHVMKFQWAGLIRIPNIVDDVWNLGEGHSRGGGLVNITARCGYSCNECECDCSMLEENLKSYV